MYYEKNETGIKPGTLNHLRANLPNQCGFIYMTNKNTQISFNFIY